MSFTAIKFLPDNIPLAKLAADVASAASVTSEASARADADALLVPLSSVGAALGVAPLDADGKLPAAFFPTGVDEILEFANLAAFPGSGAANIIYLALDTSIIYRWSGSVYVAISSSPGTTDDVVEGVTNLYFTVARAKSAAVVNSLAGTQTDQAPSVAAVKAADATNASAISAETTRATGAENTLTTAVNTANSAITALGIAKKQSITLVPLDITHQYVDCADLIVTDTMGLDVIGGGTQYEGDDYSLSTVGGKTRITFINGLATGGASALVSGDKLRLMYRA